MNSFNKLIIKAVVMLVLVFACAVSLALLLRDNGAADNNDVSLSSVDAALNNSATVSSEEFTENSDESFYVSDSREEPESSETSYVEPEKFQLEIPDNVVLYSPNVLVYNLTEQNTIYSKIEYETCAPASLTKMLTALVALDYLDIEGTVLVGDEVDMIGANSSTAYLQKGQRYKMATMLDALMLPSGNDAAYSLAVNAARAHANDYTLSNEDAVKDFVRLMNEKAKDIGCISSTFMTPDGYDAEGQYTTTDDMLKISIAAYSNPYIKESVAKPQNSQHEWYNSNMLIREDSDFYSPYATGLKTGSTDAAGKCLAVSATIGNNTYIMLFMKATGSYDRYKDANTIIDLILQQVQN